MVFLRRDGADYQLVHCRTDDVDSGGFSEPVVINSEAGRMIYTNVDTLEEWGLEIVVTVYEYDGNIHMAVSPNAAASWQEPLQVNVGTEICYEPDFIIDSDGYAQIVYVKETTDPRVYHRRADFALDK